ncbi:MAG: CoA pyrophosphatase [Rhodobacterales bacterium]|nr:CoA pyrophosphatase [Rhodobacterales bacterium]
MTTPDLIARVVAGLARDGADTSDFDLNPDVPLAGGRVLRPAAVLVPLVLTGGQAELILTKRAARLQHHAGQIAFPGGKQDAGDSGPTDAALREAEEEIGLPRACVQVLGTMSQHETVTGFAITPIVGLVHAPFDPRPEPGEVDEVFRVPLAHVLDPAQYRIEGRRWQGRRRYYFTVPYGPYYIWGATARILRALADRVGG